MRTRHVTATEPYPWPYDGIWSPGRMGLVLVACQQWWVDRSDDATAALGALSALRASARSAGLTTFLTIHSGQAMDRTRPRYLPVTGTSEAQLAVEVAPDDVVVAAAGLDACYGGPFEAILRGAGIDRLLIAGLGLEGPVHSTLRSLNDQGYECLLVADACGANGASTRSGAVSSVLMSGGIFGAVGSTAAAIDALATLER